MQQLQTYQHFPTLKTILVVEKLLKDHEGDLLSKAQIDRLLGGRVNRMTLNLILDYLEESNKIIQHPTKGIMWVYAEKSKIDKLLKNARIV